MPNVLSINVKSYISYYVLSNYVNCKSNLYLFLIFFYMKEIDIIINFDLQYKTIVVQALVTASLNWFQGLGWLIL